MADYYAPTVIQPIIPAQDMTPLERLLLSNIFTAEESGDGVYFYAEERPADFVDVSREDVVTALAASPAGANPGVVLTHVVASLAQCAPDAAEIELDLSAVSWEFIFQEIVRRSSSLRYVTALTAFTCSKMRADGFGGMAVLITADRIFSKSTGELIEEFMTEAGLVD